MPKIWRWLYSAVVVACVLLLVAVVYCTICLPDSFIVSSGEEVLLGDWVSVSAGARIEKTEATYAAPMRLFGVVPIKNVTVSVADAPIVSVCGIPFGIKLYTDGVLVVGMSDVSTAAGDVNPAAKAGIRIGDTILSVDGMAVTTNEEVAKAINASGGRIVTMRVKRDGVEFDAVVLPVRPQDGEGYRVGMWVRDSTAGVGTLTFYDEASGLFAGLGHPVCDADTGQILPISTGEIVPARILGVTPGAKGTPGELQGVFERGSLGCIVHNGVDGLYGYAAAMSPTAARLPVARKQEVQTGAAEIWTTIDGVTPEAYSVEILQVRYAAANDTRSMVIRVTDERLLSATGGIVQGMSGSPVIQNGKLVGAVTHVLVDDPTKGYGIFVENMLETARSLEQLKEAG